MWLRIKEKKSSKTLLDFTVQQKTKRVVGGIQKNLQSKSKHKNNKCLSWITAVRVLSLSGSHSPAHLPRMLSNTVLISGPPVVAALILIWSSSCVFLPPMSSAIWNNAFSFVGALDDLLYILWTQSLPSWVCGFNLQLVSWWEGFGSSSLGTLPLGFNCGFISTSACGSSTGVQLLRLPWRAWVWPCEGQVWRRCSCLGCRGSGSTSYSAGLAARAAGNTVL